VKALLLVSCALASACGAVCGDGQAEGDEQCDDGNTVDGDGCSASCRAQDTVDTFVHFAPFIAEQFPGFNETCLGLEIAQVEVSIAGPRAHSQRVDCAFGQIKVSGLPAGSYTATAVAFDAAGTAISRGLARVDFTVGDADQNVNVAWPWEDFTRGYSGTFYFKVLWQGATRCQEAAVTQQRLRLERDGQPLAGTTQSGDPIDGSATGTCRDGAEGLSQAVVALGWGPARFVVSGEDDAGRTMYQGSFDTFVGAGVANPTLTFDVPSILPDAGPVDAAPADGGP
jgi:cysteine-rich repeat protein